MLTEKQKGYLQMMADGYELEKNKDEENAFLVHPLFSTRVVPRVDWIALKNDSFIVVKTGERYFTITKRGLNYLNKEEEFKIRDEFDFVEEAISTAKTAISGLEDWKKSGDHPKLVCAANALENASMQIRKAINLEVIKRGEASCRP